MGGNQSRSEGPAVTGQDLDIPDDLGLTGKQKIAIRDSFDFLRSDLKGNGVLFFTQ